jgi:ribosomal protein L7/L12
MSMTSEAKKEVEELLRRGQKLQAVKYLCDTFALSLHESKTLVEVVENQITAQPASINENFSSTSLTGPVRDEVIRMLHLKKKMEAVKYVKTELNTGLKEALELVEEVEKIVNPNYRSLSVGKGCAGAVFKIIAILFGLAGIIMLVAAGLIHYFQQESIQDSDLVMGTVVDLKSSDITNGGAAPVISYMRNGEKKLYQSNLYSSPPDYQINEAVQLYISRDNPEEGMIDSFFDRWFLITIFGGLGAFFLLFGSLFLFASRKF